MTGTILLVFSFVFFVIGTFWGPWCSPSPGPVWGRFNFVSAGLACWVLALLIGGHVFR